MAAHRNEIHVWQWNCRSFRAKRNNLQLHLQTLANPNTPTIIALQETQIKTKLCNYTTHEPEGKTPPRVAILVHRNLTATDHPLEVNDIDSHLVELLPSTRKGGSLFVLNIYSPPKGPAAPLLTALRKALSISSRHPL